MRYVGCARLTGEDQRQEQNQQKIDRNKQQ
jgi:hypothetical protein